MINAKRRSAIWFAYDLKAITTTGMKFEQGYYEDEYEEAIVDAETLRKLGYANVTLTEREWHKERRKRNG